MPRPRSSSFFATSPSGSQPARTRSKFSVGPVHVQRRGRKGFYEARWFDGKRRRRSLKTSDYFQAERLAAELADNHSSKPVQQPGEWNSPHSVGSALPGSPATPVVTEELPTLDVALDHFLAKKLSERRAPKTLSRYRHELTRLVHFLAGRAVTRIDRLRAEHYTDYLDRSKRTRHISTLHDDVVIAKTFAKWLSDRYDLRNPLRTITPPRIPDRSCHVLTIDEVHAILNGARREDR